MNFSYTVRTKKTIEDVISSLRSSLSQIEFGIIGTLDFKEIFQKKGIEYEEEYKLLEVCNPQIAKQALDSDPEIGLLLPCTISIYSKKGQNYISLARPSALLAVTSVQDLQEIGKRAEDYLIQAIEKSK